MFDSFIESRFIIIIVGLFYQPLAKYNVATDPVQNLITIDCMVSFLFLRSFEVKNILHLTFQIEIKKGTLAKFVSSCERRETTRGMCISKKSILIFFLKKTTHKTDKESH